MTRSGEITTDVADKAFEKIWPKFKKIMANILKIMAIIIYLCTDITN